MFTWKYGLIKVEDDHGEDLCHLVELVEDEDGGFTSFCDARIKSVVELTRAHDDVQRDGVNTWFFDNGTFSWVQDSLTGQHHWDWTCNEA